MKKERRERRKESKERGRREKKVKEVVMEEKSRGKERESEGGKR